MSALLPNLCQVGFKLEFADSNQFFVTSTPNVKPQLHIKGKLYFVHPSIRPSAPPLAGPQNLLDSPQTCWLTLKPDSWPSNLLTGPQTMRSAEKSLKACWRSEAGQKKI